MELILIRHPLPDVPPGTCYGRLDIPAGPSLPLDIHRVSESLPEGVRLVSSPALRARSLAEGVAARRGLDLAIDERVHEMHMGDWEGLLWRELPKELTTHWMSDPMTLSPPGGESFSQVIARVSAALIDHGRTAPVAIFCHAGVVRAAEMALTGRTFKQVFSRDIPYAEPISFALSLLERLQR
ncbi:MAG: hypothetical protein GC199_04720 [Alphaproteobacteria bacterium]|nr:hypothetical protein [Alphaproteobacteria bacterium]